MAWFEARDFLKDKRVARGLKGPASQQEIKELAQTRLDEMIHNNEEVTLYGYKCVSYDERLYDECKKANAANGVVDLDDLNPIVRYV